MMMQTKLLEEFWCLGVSYENSAAPETCRPVGAGPVPALAGKTDATISTVAVQGRPQVAPLQSFFIRSGEPQDHGNFVVSLDLPRSPQRHQDTRIFRGPESHRSSRIFMFLNQKTLP